MKKLLLLLMMSFSMSVFAQKQITKFMGIPIDGLKKNMIQKLKEKGFEYDQQGKYLTGEINGEKVLINVVTNNNKVYRIMLVDLNSKNESQIKLRFNNLCDQFQNNERYLSLNPVQKIPQDERVSYEMSVNKKEYQAGFYQKLENANDSIAMRELGRKRAVEHIREKYGLDLEKYGMDWRNVDSITACRFMEQAFHLSPDSIIGMDEQVRDSVMNLMEQQFQQTLTLSVFSEMFQELGNRSVWFSINEVHGEYSIVMFYDNLYNRANGEDL